MLDYRVSGDTLTLYVSDEGDWQTFLDDVGGHDKVEDNAFTPRDEYEALDDAGLLGNGLDYATADQIGEVSEAPFILVDEGAFVYNDYEIHSWLTTMYDYKEVEFERFADYEEIAEILFGD